MAKYNSITSSSELASLLQSHEYTLIDFWATWCPPCKAIAPIFERLAAENATDKTLAFAKVDVDACRDIAQRYKISAMPTFLLLRKDVPVKAVRGADAAGIKKLVGYARKKGCGEKVSEKEEEEFSQVEFGGGGGGSWLPLVVVVLLLVWWFLGRGK
ncbi:thioredoxin-like protein [Bimuria novae-zelandiae CBS 107.79]|uniref:Thioredoxin-like protein n=1 Tax=Bimuria novae-zelandiae CBS 107.79 TaxID=1447943 RepID=A0A6A5VMC1_9PLEO|nr:thioredoxin-like protein [Bimuria novae-zelandiae CBS 107.79]